MELLKPHPIGPDLKPTIFGKYICDRSICFNSVVNKIQGARYPFLYKIYDFYTSVDKIYMSSLDADETDNYPAILFDPTNRRKLTDSCKESNCPNL